MTLMLCFPELAKPFVPPTQDTPLRFRYTTYLGETHPFEKKVVLEFSSADLPSLNPTQRQKLIKLVGVRYNPSNDIVKMSCDMFETQAQNKRYLGDLVDSLLNEARDPSDTFEDIPVDFRHHNFKTRLQFPDGWKMTAERAKQLKDGRKTRALAERAREDADGIVDGIRQIEVAYTRMALPGKRGQEAIKSLRGSKVAVPSRMSTGKTRMRR